MQFILNLAQYNHDNRSHPSKCFLRYTQYSDERERVSKRRRVKRQYNFTKWIYI